VPDVDRLAGLGIWGQAIVGKGVLAIEHAGDRLRGARERRMRGDVVDALAFDPQLARGAPKTLEELLSGSAGILRARIG
jgi:hypothetical protein